MMKWLRSILEWIKNLFAKKNMRRKISLYIADQQVDLDDQSFILFNYTMEDLSNPTIVKNSYSQQITLKGTPTNNRIFGASFRSDRRVANLGGDSGVDFNASQKTPFTIYNEMNEILESGYVKLDSVSRNGADVQYKITLYGGLGSFFYALSYDANGNKRTLADLDYLGTSNPDTELNFSITKDVVEEAWRRLLGNYGQSLVNTATTYNAILGADGSVIPQSERPTWCVKEYRTDGLSKVEVSGSAAGSATYPGIVALDANENALQTYITTEAGGFENRIIELPDGTEYIRVFAIEDNLIAATIPSASPIWDVINFAPAYNGIPDGNFAPDKGLITPTEVGLPTMISQGDGEDEVKYYLKGGYALVNLAEAQDEWAVKDLRSYLQRPVFSMKSFWEAICNPNNNGGFSVDASVIQDWQTFGKYYDLWMTLPMISSIGTFQQESGDLSLVLSSTPTSGNEIGRFTISGSVPSGTKITANLNCKIRFNVPSGANAYSELYRSVSTRVGRNTMGKMSAIFIQAVAYASDNSVVGGSKIKAVGSVGRGGVSSLADACGYTPAWSADYESVNIHTINKISNGVFEIPTEMGFTIEAQDVAYYKILVSVYPGTTYSTSSSAGHYSTRYSYSGDGSISTPVLYVDYETGFAPNSTFIIQGATANSVSYTTSENLRSGATITKSMLLSSSHTPAEYMLSFCKIFGLYFTYDAATKQVTIHKRNDLYQDETIDLTSRVDVSKGISIQPLVFNAKWYDFILEGVGGAFYDEYLQVEGVEYGIQRVNTGYDFNAESTNLMDSVVFKNACTILARSKYFNYIFKSNADYSYPSASYSANAWYTGTSVGGALTLTEVEGCKALNIQVNEGEQYQITSHGGTDGRAWYLLDINERVVSMAAANFDTTETLTIPAGVYYLVAQTDNGTISLKRIGQDTFYPSPFLDKGNSFTLWSADGETLETDISCPPANASVTYVNENPNYKGYDVNSARKLELRDAGNKPIDGADILIFHEGWNHYPYFKLTDDVPAMDVVNDGVPCWLLGAGESGAAGLYAPTFQRYCYGNIAMVDDSLDFGVPRQFDIPGISHGAGLTIYERGWKNYLADRYDVNTKIMTCRVNFAGFQVNQELLRKFYWYDNSLWVLNKIKNYSLTTYDPVECEFVQVQDKANYLTGQTY